MKTEIKPVEPDQGNACAGKDESSHLSFPVFVNPVNKQVSVKVIVTRL